MPDTIHILPTAELAERVLLPGDPGRALRLAQHLLSPPKMFNHNRGLWGYTGAARDGRLLTIQSTGMGGPSAAIVVSELHELGARRMLRVGTCGALDSDLELGQLLIATEAVSDDGVSRALNGSQRQAPGAELLADLRRAAGPTVRCGPVVSTDLFYDTPPGVEQRWRDQGALAVEMEAASLFALAGRRGFAAAAALIVSDLVLPRRQRIAPEDLPAAEQRLGELALAALSS
ncbi:MAG: purine-nucleoside phosphorylase [Actinomycetota bacterium]|nr:purine-nucleoside phosphorylase [Actinomycetota bacterium]